MRIIKVRNKENLHRQTANVIASQIILKPDSVLGLATGSTPEGTYQQLIQLYQSGDLDFSHVRTFNLDEYVGISAKHPQSYAYFMRSKLFDQINIDLSRTHIPDGMVSNSSRECEHYDELVQKAGGIDLQLLGLGPNGHIGFNEPGISWTRETHRVKLSDATIDANQRFFPSRDEVPRYAYTLGIQGIMQARHILMIVSGESKAQIVYDAFFGHITPRIPASILQLHPHFTLIVDQEAGNLIPDANIEHPYQPLAV